MGKGWRERSGRKDYGRFDLLKKDLSMEGGQSKKKKRHLLREQIN